MPHIEWEALRAYASVTILTIIAVLGIWKDSKDYKRRASEKHLARFERLLTGKAVIILYALTIVTGLFGAFDIHTTRRDKAQAATDAKLDKTASEKQIADLQASVTAGNQLLGQQRQDFLGQFSIMSNRVTQLQTEIKTADLQKEAEQLRSDLEATRKSMEVPKATLAFSFAADSGPFSHAIVLDIQDGAVKIPFTVVNDSDVDALEGTIVLRICDDCKYAAMPEGFTKLSGQDEHERSMDFQHIFARSNIPRMYVTVIPPPYADQFQIGLLYRCRTCSLVKIGIPLIPTSMGTVTLGPHWKPRQFHPKGNLLSPGH